MIGWVRMRTSSGASAARAQGVVHADRSVSGQHCRVRVGAVHRRLAEQGQDRDDHGYLGADADPGGVGGVRVPGGLPGEQQFAGQVGADLIKRPRVTTTAAASAPARQSPPGIACWLVAWWMALVWAVRRSQIAAAEQGGQIHADGGHAVLALVQSHGPGLLRPVVCRSWKDTSATRAAVSWACLARRPGVTRAACCTTMPSYRARASASSMHRPCSRMVRTWPVSIRPACSAVKGGRVLLDEQVRFAESALHGAGGDPAGHRQLGGQRPERPVQVVPADAGFGVVPGPCRSGRPGAAPRLLAAGRFRCGRRRSARSATGVPPDRCPPAR